MANHPINPDGDSSRAAWEQHGDRVFDALTRIPLPAVGDTSRSAFDWAFLSDIAALNHWKPVDGGRGLIGGALQIAAVRLVLGDASAVLANHQVNEMGSWYVRRLVSRAVDTMLGRQPVADTEADETMILLFCHHVDLTTSLELDADGRAQRKSPDRGSAP